MPTIGTRRHADEILNLHHHHNGDVPECSDWSCLGGGCMRMAYLHKPTGVVYKVETWADWEYGNEAEWKNAKALARLAWERVRIPAVSLFRFPAAFGENVTVLAMEYVEGIRGSSAGRDDYKEARVEMMHKGRLADMHGDNFLFADDGMLVPVDLGSPRLRSVTGTNQNGDEVDRRVLDCGDGSCWGRL